MPEPKTPLAILLEQVPGKKKPKKFLKNGKQNKLLQ